MVFKGVTAGDPHSLLFVVVMEAFSRMSARAVLGGYLNGFSVNNLRSESVVI